MTLTRRAAGQDAFTMFGTAGNIHEDLADDVLIQGAIDTPFLDDVGFTGPRPTNLEHKWADDDYQVFTVTANEAIDDSETAITISSGGLDLEEGTLLEVDDEIMWVTASSDDTTITVTRGACGTTAAAHDNGSTMYVVGQAVYENQEFPTARMDLRTEVKNYVQQMLVPVEVTDIARMLDSVGTPDELDWQRSKKVSAALRLLQLAVLRVNKDDTAPQGSATVAATMVGLRSLITTNSTSAASVRLTAAVLRAALKQVDDYGGMADRMLTTKFDYGIINSWNEGRVRYGPMETTAGREPILFFKSQYGTQQVMACRDVKPGELYIYPSANFTLAPLQSFALVEFAKVSTSTRLAVWGAYSSELRGQKHATKITSIAQT